MDLPHDPKPEKETVFIYNMSPELEAELIRRARENQSYPAEEAERILEGHVEENDA